MRSMVEGHPRRSRPLGAGLFARAPPPPCGWSPSPFRGGTCYPFSASAIVSLIGVVGRPESVLRSLLSLYSSPNPDR